MDTGKKMWRFLPWVGVILLQLIMTQVVTFIFSMFIKDMDTFPQTHSDLFVVILGVSFSVGVFLAGWLAIKFHWLKLLPKYPIRLLATLIGAYLPLILALFLYHTLEAGNPFFFISMIVSIFGFHFPSWIGRK